MINFYTKGHDVFCFDQTFAIILFNLCNSADLNDSESEIPPKMILKDKSSLR